MRSRLGLLVHFLVCVAALVLVLFLSQLWLSETASPNSVLPWVVFGLAIAVPFVTKRLLLGPSVPPPSPLSYRWKMEAPPPGRLIWYSKC